MSFLAMAWAARQKTGSSSKKIVLLLLADRANDKGSCFPSLLTIAEDCELGITSVKKNIKELETDGLLRIERRKEDGTCLSNIYHLNIPEIEGVGRQTTGGRSPDDRGVGRQTATNLSREPIIEPDRADSNNQPVGDSTTPPTPKKAGAPLPPTIAEVEKWAKDKGYPEELARRAWEFYERLKWHDTGGKPVRSWKHKFVAVWMTPEKIAEFKPTKERAVLKDGTLYFVDRPKCESQYMRTAYLPQHDTEYNVITPEQFNREKSCRKT